MADFREGRPDLRMDRDGRYERDDFRRSEPGTGFLGRAAEGVRSFFGEDRAEQEHHPDQRHRDHGHRGSGSRATYDGNHESDMPGWDRPDDGYNERLRDHRYQQPQGPYGQQGFGRDARGGFERDADTGYYPGDRGQGGGYTARQDHGRPQGGYDQGYNQRTGGPAMPGAVGGPLSTGDQGTGAQFHPDDHHYHSWREQQMQAMDREYHEFRQHRAERFSSEFQDWRRDRHTQAGAALTGEQWRTKIREHMEVLGADGEHVGVADKVEGDEVKLTKRNGDGRHHFVPLSAIISVDNAVRLNAPAAEAIRQWRTESGATGL
jgi:hypothetical protein